MNLEDGRGAYEVVYRDDVLTHSDWRIIVTPHGQLDSLAKKLVQDYIKHFIGGDEPRWNYLISGVLVQTNRVGFLERALSVDELTLAGETKVGIELLAERLGLPEIPDNSFAAFSEL